MIEQIKSIEQAIIATLSYFDLFEYPLKKEEIWTWLYSPNSFNYQEFEKSLNSEKVLQKVDSKDEYLFLKERENLIEIRKDRFEIDQKKWQIAKKGARILRYIPFIRLICVCNTLAFNNANIESDIDFFIVVKNNRLWLARFFATFLLDLLRMRRKGEKIQDKICLSFYVTEKTMNFEPLLIKPEDSYFAFWTAQLVPLLNRENTFEKLIEQNKWVKNYLPNAFERTKKSLIVDNSFTNFFYKLKEKALSGKLGNWLENYFKLVQKNKMDKNTESVAKEPNTKVVISDDVLKFHETDTREMIQREFERRFQLFCN
jgi:hypothetical protein